MKGKQKHHTEETFTDSGGSQERERELVPGLEVSKKSGNFQQKKAAKKEAHQAKNAAEEGE